MRKIISAIVVILIYINVHSQNVGIGTTEPFNKLHVTGNLLVQGLSKKGSAAPTPAQHYTMVNGSTFNIPAADSVYRVYDPGGPAGNYNANLIAYTYLLYNASSIGVEITIESIALGTGDSLIIRQSPSTSSPVLLAVGNNYTTTGKIVFPGGDVYIIFKSNSDASTGSGFSLLLKRIFEDTSNTLVNGGALSKSLFYDAVKGAFRAGQTTSNRIGNYSAAMGFGSTATGSYSFAAGYNSDATGNSAIAMGFGSNAIGDHSIAMGNQTRAENQGTAIGNFAVASGTMSIAMGPNTQALGYSSTSLGSGSVASGSHSVAIGNYANASAEASLATGYNTNASGAAATALGNSTAATGFSAVAMGTGTTASGSSSTAMGYNTTASGNYSTAMGSYVSTRNEQGALVIGDNSTTSIMEATSPNSFRARFAGGYRFYTTSNLTANALLSAGSNAWSTTSDYRLKENFITADGESFLKKIAGMKLGSWNYKTQDAAEFRHYGPMAQDFYAAFGKDDFGSIGNDTTINQADFDGVNLIAIQALEKRTTLLQAENKLLLTTIREQQKLMQSLQKEMEAIKKKKRR